MTHVIHDIDVAKQIGKYGDAIPSHRRRPVLWNNCFSACLIL